MHPDIYKRPLFFGLIFLITIIFFFYKPFPEKNDVYYWLDKKDVTLVGRVEQFYVAKTASNNVIVKVKTVNGQKTDGKVYARLKNFEPNWKDTLEIKGRLQRPYGVDLLGNFNWQKYLAEKQVFTEIKSEQVRVVKQAAWPWRAIRTVRENVLQVFNENFPPPLADIAGGVLLGERGELPKELVGAFQDSGAIHLLVASGGNVGFVTLMTLAVCGLLGVGRKKAVFLGLAIAGIYTLIAGADAPLLRAYFMAVCACSGYYLGRNSGVWQGLLVSCLVILLVRPAALFETGFEMSFLATAALIMGLANFPIPLRWPKMIRFFAQIFVATVAVQLALLPVFTNVFYKVSVIGPVANMVLVPLASVLLGMTSLFYVFSLLHVSVILYYPVWFCLTLFECLVEGFAALKGAAVPVVAWGSGYIAAYYVLLFWGLHAPVKKWTRNGLIAAFCVAGSALAVQLYYERGTQVYVLDEWHKNAVLIKTDSTETFVVTHQLDPEKLQAALRKIGRLQADAVFLTAKPSAKKDYTPLAPVVVYPFETSWPEKSSWKFGKTSVRLIWGLRETKNGRLWQNIGYTGTRQDDVSYCFKQDKKEEFCVGADARFVRLKNKTIDPVVNSTVKEKL